jgi:catechol 2,3-dioxygenase-like lactoylglutathione lyase family enzyme
MVLLFDARVASQPATHGGLDVPTHGTTGQGHLCFAVSERDLDGWLRQLVEHGVTIEKDLHWPGGGRSLYFRDPSSNSLELATPKIWGMEDSS